MIRFYLCSSSLRIFCSFSFNSLANRIYCEVDSMAICSLISVWVRIIFYVAHAGLDFVPQLIDAGVKLCVFVVEEFDEMGNGVVEVLLFFVFESNLEGLLVESEDLFEVFDIVFEELVLFFEEIQ